MIQQKSQQLKEAEEAVEVAEKQIEEIKKEILDEICPYKVGQIVEGKGYSYRGSRVKIISIQMGREILNKSGFSIVVYARVLKKDGTESANTVGWRDWNDPLLEEALRKLKS